jgi:predicted ATPase/DNA-binding SARP family transcriptional activator
VLRLKTFGGLSLENEGTPLRGAAAQRRRLSMLAVLAVAGRRGASRDKLVGLLWPDVDEPRARSALSQSLYALKHDSGVDELVMGYETLSLNSAALTSDVAEFEDALARNDLARAAEVYTGTFLDGVHLSAASEFEHWLDETRFRFGRAAEQAIESLAVQAEQANDYAVAAEWWRRLTAMDPLKTRAVIGLMSALAGSGDRSGAIRHAERYERHVRDGVDDAPSTAVMEYADRLRRDLRDERFAALPSQLPFVCDEMIGRERELESACSLLARPDVSLLTLTGAGGTGKTRLAVQVARSLEAGVDRVYFVDLASVRESANVMPAIVAATGAQLVGRGDEVDAVGGALRGGRALLVLDNFEQVVAAAPLIARLLGLTPGLKLLITSRIRLGIRAEHEFFVGPLALPERGTSASALRDNPAIQLFVRRALAINSALTFDDETLAAAARICTRVDGLPLAIELAAARCRLMSPRAIATRIERGFDVVSGGGRDVPARHQTIREAIAWSVDLLKPAERRAFACMATFSGACTFAAAEFVCAGESSAAEALDDLSGLIDASVVMRDPPATDGEPRLRMLETVREVALGELLSASQRDAVAARHAEWYERLAASLAPELTGEEQHRALATLALDHANLTAAVDWSIQAGDVRRALSLGSALWRYWLVRGYLVEGRALLARVLGMARVSTSDLDALRADAMSGAAHLAQNSGAVGEAESYFRAALEIRRRQADDVGTARALADLGWIAWRQCDFAKARQLSTECLALAEAVGATRIAAQALTNLGAASLFEGDYDAARSALSRSVELRGKVADRRGVAVANTFLAWTLCRAGSTDAAVTLLDDAERALHRLGDERLVYFVRDTRAEVLLRMGDAARAATVLDVESMKGGRRFGDRWSVARGLALASWALRLLGDRTRAESFARESLELRRAEGDRHGEAESRWLLELATTPHA